MPGSRTYCQLFNLSPGVDIGGIPLFLESDFVLLAMLICLSMVKSSAASISSHPTPASAAARCAGSAARALPRRVELFLARKPAGLRWREASGERALRPFREYGSIHSVRNPRNEVLPMNSGCYGPPSSGRPLLGQLRLALFGSSKETYHDQSAIWMMGNALSLRPSPLLPRPQGGTGRRPLLAVTAAFIVGTRVVLSQVRRGLAAPQLTAHAVPSCGNEYPAEVFEQADVIRLSFRPVVIAINAGNVASNGLRSVYRRRC